jgi:hypothetical protein
VRGREGVFAYEVNAKTVTAAWGGMANILESIDFPKK